MGRKDEIQYGAVMNVRLWPNSEIAIAKKDIHVCAVVGLKAVAIF
jgi:hypothetical protein